MHNQTKTTHKNTTPAIQPTTGTPDDQSIYLCLPNFYGILFGFIYVKAYCCYVYVLLHIYVLVSTLQARSYTPSERLLWQEFIACAASTPDTQRSKDKGFCTLNNTSQQFFTTALAGQLDKQMLYWSGHSILHADNNRPQWNTKTLNCWHSLPLSDTPHIARLSRPHWNRD